MKTISRHVFFLLLILDIALSSSVNAQSCDDTCLTEHMDNFINAMLEQSYRSIPLSSHAEIRENGPEIALYDSAWNAVQELKSRLTFTDSLTGNVLSRVGVELSDGHPGYFSVRLKISNNKITDVELTADTRQGMVVADYVYNLEQVFEQTIPESQRSNREELETIVRRYFQDLSDQDPRPEDFADSCNRYHSGIQITNTAGLTGVEGEGGRNITCFLSVLGPKPWGPAIEHRVPLIDTESGIVFGTTLLLYIKPEAQDRRPMIVSELFQIIDGKIQQIDNIGIKDDVETLGFAH